ncbi:hypothetical protein SAMN02745121_08227 [Nannocystis exedens]|uniref:Uncharacterized protein n=1 Tax=Nannocystis exedens TaxID=54 RepID=A0A1I2HYP0_9BACT|nr:hypothetical protein [Nannocystis exedens]PCC72044.1 hypothetical protein NAEX_05123 [Nannocystis exedens]SFF33756.1 hypothetical protein SAMN02745121_08227 [Nannocystis exedens]
MKAEELRQALDQLGTTESEEDDGRFVAHVVSPQFEGMQGAERQFQVWERVRGQFGLRAGVDIEFIFTDSPSEWERLNRGEGLDELQD